jgi:hypothetical protein
MLLILAYHIYFYSTVSARKREHCKLSFYSACIASYIFTQLAVLANAVVRPPGAAATTSSGKISVKIVVKINKMLITFYSTCSACKRSREASWSSRQL